MKKTKAILICLSLILFRGSASAAMRLWTDRDGNLIEGEFVRIASNELVVRDAQGLAHYIPMNGLSKNDIEFVTSVFVPDLQIDFSTRSHVPKRSEIALSTPDRIEIVTGRVKIESKQKIPNDTLQAEAYLIGAEVATPDYRIINKLSIPLNLTAENQYRAEFELAMESRWYTEYNYQERGVFYDGYLIVVLNQKKEVIQYKTNLRWLNDEAVPLLRQFQIDAFFNEECKPRPVPRPDFSTSRVGIQ